MKLRIITVSILIAILGCSSAPKDDPSPELPVSPPPPLASEVQPDKVLSRINGLNSRPEWLNEEKSFEIKGGKLVSMGQTTIPGDNRVEAAYMIAENNAKGSICAAIENRLDFIFQQAEESTAIDSIQIRRIGAEACKLTTSSLRPGHRYWEKVAVTADSGDRTTRYKVFATVEMPEQEFKKAILDTARRRQGKDGLSEDFAKKVDERWDQFAKDSGK